jgi:hypothetical protein
LVAGFIHHALKFSENLPGAALAAAKPLRNLSAFRTDGNP